MSALLSTFSSQLSIFDCFAAKNWPAFKWMDDGRLVPVGLFVGLTRQAAYPLSQFGRLTQPRAQFQDGFRGPPGHGRLVASHQPLEDARGLAGETGQPAQGGIEHPATGPTHGPSKVGVRQPAVGGSLSEALLGTFGVRFVRAPFAFSRFWGILVV